MNNYSSPYGSTPGVDYYEYRDRFGSPSPTPSPRASYYFGHQTPQRPATRAHFRQMSASGFASSNEYASARPPSFSPRYTSDGQYATANVSASRSSRKEFGSGLRIRRGRRESHSYMRTSERHGESDEDEYFMVDGVTYVLPAQHLPRRHSDFFTRDGHPTDHPSHAQSGLYDRETGYSSPRFDSSDRRPSGHFRRASGSAPQHRPSTARPTSSHKRASAAPPTPAKATEADAKRAGIPSGYSIKNWDPAEEPILLLGSVFDANSLGKWIYDWTVYHHTPKSPISDMAGEMWLSLISLSGKLRHAEEMMPKIRSQENKEMVNDFIASGERITDKLRKLLKACEAPMLKASKRKDAQLGKNAGVEFVETLFGHERELDRTQRFMQSVHIWNLRFDANCAEILKNPTK